MAVIYMEGFETLGSDTGIAYQSDVSDRFSLRVTAEGSGISPVTTGYFLIDDSLTEGYALCMGTNSSSNGCYFDLKSAELSDIQLGAAGPSTPTVIVGLNVHTPNKAGRSAAFFQVRGQFGGSGWDNNFNVAYSDSDMIVTFASGINLRVTTVNNVFTPGAWHYVEMKFKCADLADGGKLIINVNEINVLTQDPIDLNNGMGIEPYERFRFQGTNASTDTGDYTAFDDLYVVDAETAPHTDFLTPVRIRSLPPNIDYARWWANNDGSFDNYDKIDENGADDTDYVETDQDGYTDIYGCTNTDTDYPDEVYAVKVEAEAINTTGGTPKLTFQLISGASTSEESITVDDTVNYDVVSIISAVDPATSAAWTVAAVDAMKLGLKFDNGY
jgi:hypothetical protein